MENKTKIHFMELPTELASHFVLRFITCFIGYIAILIFALATKLYRESIVMAIILSCYLGSVLLLLTQTLKGKLLVYEGVYADKKGKAHSLKVPMAKKPLITSYSYSYLTLNIEVDGEEQKIEVPCNFGFVAEEGNVIRVYTRNTGIYEKNENTIVINNPIIVKVIKS